MLSQAFNIIIDHGVSASGHVKEVVDGLNTTDKKFILRSISTVQLPGSQKFDT